MNRTDIMRQVADRVGVPVAVVETVTGSLFDVIIDGLEGGNVVNIRRFGKFELRVRRAVTRNNPRTKEPMQIPDKITVAFLPSSTVKDRLNPI